MRNFEYEGRAPDVEFEVIGVPGPQGSKRFVGRGIMIESSDKVRPWREAVAWAGRTAMGSLAPLEGALVCQMVFTMPKSKSAPKKRRTLPYKKPDTSKLIRSTEDAMTTGGVWKDDAQVVKYIETGKVFPNEDPDAMPCLGAVVRVWRVV